MDLANTSFFGMLRTRLGQLSERQRLISENIANSATPGFTPRDLDTSAFERMLAARGGAHGAGLTMARTQPGHMGPGGAHAVSGGAIVNRPDSETTLDGNGVVLEDETVRASETRMAFETGIALYQKGLALVRLAARAPGR